MDDPWIEKQKLMKSKSRREFLTGAAAIGVAGALGAGHLLSSCSTRRERYETPLFIDIAPDGPPLKAGLIGCGGRGTGAAINFISAGPNLQITALGDVFQHRVDSCRKTLKDNHNIDIPDSNCFTGFDAYRKVIDSGVDVILEATPQHFRPAHFEAAVQARKHVFIEKPAAVDPAGVRSVMASGRMAEAAGLSVVAGTIYRHQRDYITTFSRIKNGAIGDLISANAYRIGGPIWHVNRQEGWCDMEAMLRDWMSWRWLSGSNLIDVAIHQFDIVNWFFEKYPVKALGFGGRHHRQGGDVYDFFSVDYTFDDGKNYQCMNRHIAGCDNKSGQIIYGTKGYTNCQNKIYDYDDNLIWEFEYPLDSNGQPTGRLPISSYDQEMINLVTAIRTNKPVNQAHDIASSTMTGIMGTESAETGREVTWEEMMNSNKRLGPEEYRFGAVNIKAVPPVPGTPSSA
jgi:myo-inositol 2-dehydrogenase / D-chiro-inositol 1-dehydrogenase